MTIAGIIRIIFFILAGIALIFALRSLMAGVRSRSSASKQYFNVGRLEAQRQVFAKMISTVGLVILAIVLALIAALVPDDLLGSVGEESTEQPVAEVVDAVEPETAVAVVENGGAEESGSMSTGAEGEAGVTIIEPTLAAPTAIPTETPEPTPDLKTVYVNSPIVGLYIRDLPEGDIIDVLDDQTQLGILEEGEEIEGILWIKVVTLDGREGWVAEQFTTNVLPISLGETEN